jgi:hypothetical protein
MHAPTDYKFKGRAHLHGNVGLDEGCECLVIGVANPRLVEGAHVQACDCDIT